MDIDEEKSPYEYIDITKDMYDGVEINVRICSGQTNNFLSYLDCINNLH